MNAATHIRIDHTIIAVPGLSHLIAIPARYDRSRVTEEDAREDSAIRPARLILGDLRRASLACWTQCVDTAAIDGGEARQVQAEGARDAAEEAWSDALRAAELGDVDGCRAALETARALAAEWGDDSEERKALAMLEAS